jgi:hypothetical protein
MEDLLRGPLRTLVGLIRPPQEQGFPSVAFAVLPQLSHFNRIDIWVPYNCNYSLLPLLLVAGVSAGAKIRN